MKANIKNAAKNAYDGMKALSDEIENHESYSNIEDFVAALEEIQVKYQPLLATYCVSEELSEAESTREEMLEKTFEHCFAGIEPGSDVCKKCGLDIRDGVHIRG